jgi:hypothetical protein
MDDVETLERQFLQCFQHMGAGIGGCCCMGFAGNQALTAETAEGLTDMGVRAVELCRVQQRYPRFQGMADERPAFRRGKICLKGAEGKGAEDQAVDTQAGSAQGYFVHGAAPR